MEYKTEIVKPSTWTGQAAKTKHHATYGSQFWQSMKFFNEHRGASYSWYDALRVGGLLRRFLGWIDKDSQRQEKIFKKAGFEFSKTGDFVAIRCSGYAFVVDLRTMDLQQLRNLDNARSTQPWRLYMELQESAAKMDHLRQQAEGTLPVTREVAAHLSAQQRQAILAEAARWNATTPHANFNAFGD
jgi:hypothetical protein